MQLDNAKDRAVYVIYHGTGPATSCCSIFAQFSLLSSTAQILNVYIADDFSPLVSCSDVNRHVLFTTDLKYSPSCQTLM